MTLHCEPWRERLVDHIGGHLPPREAKALERHLADCASCRALLADWQGLRQSLSGLDEGLPVPGAASALAKVDALLEERSREPAVAAAFEPSAGRRKAILSAAALLILGLGLAGLQGARDPSGSTDSEPQLAVETLDDGGSESRLAATVVPRRARPRADLLLGPDAPRGGALEPADAPGSAGAGSARDAWAAATARDVAPMPEPETAGEGLPSGGPGAEAPGRQPLATPTEAGSAGQATEPPAMPPPARPPRRPHPPVTEAPARPATPAPTALVPTPVPTAVARIAGRVEDPAGQGLAWALVLLRPEPDDGRRFLLTDTAGDGSFALSLPAGRYRMVVEAEGFEPTWLGGEQPAVLVLGPGSVLQDLVVRLPAAAAPTPSPTPGDGSGPEPPPMPWMTALPDPDPGSGGNLHLPVDPVLPGSPTDELQQGDGE